MAKKNKTEATAQSVTDFIGKIPSEEKRDDSHQLISVYSDVTGFEPTMWGPSIVGFGSYHYKYASGHEGDAPVAAFSPRKPAIVVYLNDFPERNDMLKKLGKCKISGGCIHISKLENVDIGVLKKLISKSAKYIQKKYPTK